MIDPDAAIDFLAFVEERHRIWQQRQEFGSSHTDDPTLATRKFTNIYRVLDPGSQFVFELDTPDLHDRLARLFLYRYTNLPATWRHVREQCGHYPLAADMDDPLIAEIQRYRDAGNKVFSGAYVILPQPNISGDKVEQAVQLTAHFMNLEADHFLAATSQAERLGTLTHMYGVGQFLGMQILTDWGYLCPEDREDDFIVLGPGSTRGSQALGMKDAIQWAHDAIHASPTCPVVEGRKPSLMDVQNCLCEYSKLVRYNSKPPSTKLYVPAHPGVQVPPILPSWW